MIPICERLAKPIADSSRSPSMITRPRKVSIGYAEFMTPWITHSSPSRQALYGIISSALGALLVAAVLASGHRTENATLGGLLLVIGAAGLLTTGKQTVTIDLGDGESSSKNRRFLAPKAEPSRVAR